MKQSMREFLMLKHWPAALSVEWASYALGWSEEEVRILIRKGVLPCLGGARGSERKDISSEELRSLMADPQWMSKARRTIIEAWRFKNRNRLDDK
jgi:hypothetical protein